MNTNVYCIIVTYNAMKWVDKCLTSLRESKTQIIPVIIDNCSKDDTVIYVKEHYPEAHLIINNDNRGFGQANNQGIEWAYKQGATHFFLLNQDAWILNDAVTKAISIQEKYDIDIAVPVHLNGTERAFDFGFNNYINAKDIKKKMLEDVLLCKLEDYYEVPFVNAAGWIISRKTIEIVGGFDPIFFHYGEDRNYEQRIHFHKKRFCVIPYAFMVHDREQKGNIAVYNKRFMQSYLLAYFADVNRNMKKRTVSDDLRVYLYVIKLLFTCLCNFNFSLFVSHVQGISSVCKQYNKIKTSIRTNSKQNASWLNI